MDNNLQPHKPDIITGDIEVVRFHRKINVHDMVGVLIEGTDVLVADYYSSGLKLLNSLKQNLKRQYKGKDFETQRAYRYAFREASHHLLLKVENHKLRVRKSPEIGWFERLYPDEDEYYMSFPDVQGLNSSWQWYIKGLHIEVLNLEIHPYYGTYFPTRFDHLELFNRWLGEYSGSKTLVYDIGIGSGVLSFQLIKSGFSEVIGTDSNPNAIIGISEELKRMDLKGTLTLRYGDLFAESKELADLIIFNPPWLIAKHPLQEGIDKAIYYEPDLFPRFFEQAKDHLKADGKLVILFSNLAEVVGVSSKHPILQELEEESRFIKEHHLQRIAQPSSSKTRRKSFREDEKVELWVLKLK